MTAKIKKQKTKKNLLKPANYVKTTSKKRKCAEMGAENATPKRAYVVKQKKDDIHSKCCISNRIIQVLIIEGKKTKGSIIVVTDFDDKENWNNTLEEELFEHNTNEDVMLEESIGIESIDDYTISDSGKEYIQLLLHHILTCLLLLLPNHIIFTITTITTCLIIL